MKKKSIGFFGGSFDPIHIGHLHLAISLSELCGLDQVIFCPAFVSPFKLDKRPHASTLHRAEMVEIAIRSIPNFVFCDYELKEDSPSYTYDTIQYLNDKYSQQKQNVEIRLILGDDALPGIHKWKNIDQLLQVAKPLVGTRCNSIEVSNLLSSSSKDVLKNNLIDIPVLDISSTLLRDRIKKGLYCQHLIPNVVLEYIIQKQLYQ
ncbi:MAG: nicotinate (nicotinamide) nucleotide adenylyltransferase [Chlamydiae bacterium]|nr:nicotinate (nicotinamide) nucleotide adenylyltransferase [Chlamydiota bacterium]